MWEACNPQGPQSSHLLRSMFSLGHKLCNKKTSSSQSYSDQLGIIIMIHLLPALIIHVLCNSLLVMVILTDCTTLMYLSTSWTIGWLCTGPFHSCWPTSESMQAWCTITGIIVLSLINPSPYSCSWSKTVGVFWHNAAETWIDITNSAANKVHLSIHLSIDTHVTASHIIVFWKYMYLWYLEARGRCCSIPSKVRVLRVPKGF